MSEARDGKLDSTPPVATGHEAKVAGVIDADQSLSHQHGQADQSIPSTSERPAHQHEQADPHVSSGPGHPDAQVSSPVSNTPEGTDPQYGQAASPVSNIPEGPNPQHGQAASPVSNTPEGPGPQQEQANSPVSNTPEGPNPQHGQAASPVSNTPDGPGPQQGQAASLVSNTPEGPGPQHGQAASSVSSAPEGPNPSGSVNAPESSDADKTNSHDSRMGQDNGELEGEQRVAGPGVEIGVLGHDLKQDISSGLGPKIDSLDDLSIKGEPLLDSLSRRSSEHHDPEAAQKTLKYPKVVFFIISNEFCERFSYYGMRTVLSLFLVNALKYPEADATVIYHVFAMLCYFFPVLGAIIADSYLGKFYTIAYLSVVYAIGNITISVASATNIGIPSKELAFLGLLLISIGTGGIKPCVSAFGGDQFVLPQQKRQLASFFSVFYFSINAGSLISTYLTPELRTTECFGEKTCFPLAFGVPAALMVVSLVIFVLGKPGYKIIKPKGNVLVQVAKCMGNAWTNKLKSKENKSHWLDHADSRFSEKLRSDIRAVLRVLLLFVPLPIFWALYDQQGSRWTFQANNMNGRIGSWVIKPDQMQVVNPLLILLTLPLFETVVYPALNKCGLLTRPLQRMAAGGVIAAIAFIVSGILELQLEPNYAVPLEKGLAQVRVFNALPCDLRVAAAGGLDEAEEQLGRMGLYVRTNIKAQGNVTFDLQISGSCVAPGTKIPLFVEEEESVSYHLYTSDSTQNPTKILSSRFTDDLTKDANPQVRVLYHFSDTAKHTLKLKAEDDETTLELKGTGDTTAGSKVEPADLYSISLDGKVVGSYRLDVGGIYTVLVDNSDTAVLTVVTPNEVFLLWLLPQYIIMTVAEVMFSVTGLEFAFTQAPVTMKSVLTSAWLLTVAFGNLIVVLITEIRFFSSQASEFFLFAGLMLGVLVIFIWLAMRYTYVVAEKTEDEPTDSANQTQQQLQVISNEKNGKS